MNLLLVNHTLAAAYPRPFYEALSSEKSINLGDGIDWRAIVRAVINVLPADKAALSSGFLPAAI